MAVPDGVAAGEACSARTLRAHRETAVRFVTVGLE